MAARQDPGTRRVGWRVNRFMALAPTRMEVLHDNFTQADLSIDSLQPRPVPPALRSAVDALLEKLGLKILTEALRAYVETARCESTSRVILSRNLVVVEGRDRTTFVDIWTDLALGIFQPHPNFADQPL